MAKSSNQKQKILFLAQYLLNETDQEHPATVSDLIRYLSVNDIRAERKSLYDDMETLRQFGLDVICNRGRGGGYFVGEREFELSELKLLVDVVQSSRFLTRKKSEGLIRKLQTLVSRHQGKSLSRTVFVANRIKTENETIYLNVDGIHRAIEEDRQICFRYFERDLSGRKRYRREGGEYTVSPYHLVWDDENYYLIAVEEESGKKRHYRVDKMTDVRQTEKPRQGKEEFLNFDPAAYEKKLFGMFNGAEETVTLLCHGSLAGVFYDRFGENLVLRKRGEDFEVTLSVLVSPVFFSWLAGFGNRVRILSPENVREGFCRLLKEAISSYE